MNVSQKNTLGVGLTLLMICFLFFMLSQREEVLSVDLVPAMNESVLISVKGDITHLAVVDSEIIELSENSVLLDSTLTIQDEDSASSRRVLLVGDSQLEGLRLPVYNYCKWNNLNLVSSVVWYGSTSKQWGTSDTLEHFIDKYKPAFVFIALGLNELFVNDLEKRKEYVKSIKNKLTQKGVGYYWIGPAAWKADKGIVSILSELNENRFFDSSKLTLERAEDGRHPSRGAAWVWMEEVSKDVSAKGIVNLMGRGDRSSKCVGSPFILLSK
jgi:hypothetical protein